jgi:hypothetical protein
VQFPIPKCPSSLIAEQGVLGVLVNGFITMGQEVKDLQDPPFLKASSEKAMLPRVRISI